MYVNASFPDLYSFLQILIWIICTKTYAPAYEQQWLS